MFNPPPRDLGHGMDFPSAQKGFAQAWNPLICDDDTVKESKWALVCARDRDSESETRWRGVAGTVQYCRI